MVECSVTPVVQVVMLTPSATVPLALSLKQGSLPTLESPDPGVMVVTLTGGQRGRLTTSGYCVCTSSHI